MALIRPDFYVFASGTTLADANELILRLGETLALTDSSDRVAAVS
ncbi:hypothetical protein [Arthrobacter sp. MA-N2]|nr:hypothetical protein [Arthrobacter sp. MA-N2]